VTPQGTIGEMSRRREKKGLARCGANERRSLKTCKGVFGDLSKGDGNIEGGVGGGGRIYRGGGVLRAKRSPNLLTGRWVEGE